MKSAHAMTGEAQKKLGAFFSSFREAARPLLMLDYDGTLAPFRVDRFQARPWAGIRDSLERIRDQGRTRIVVVTGRPAKEIAPLLGLKPALEVWGLHGAERLLTNGKRQMKHPPRAAQAKLSKLGIRLRHEAFGGLLEEKANAAVMHWRGVPAAKAKIIEKRTRELFEPLARIYGLTLLEFEAGLELRAGPEKGDAVKSLLDETTNHVPRPAAYLGDDLTDEAAFQAIKGRGLGILVRRERRRSAADVWLRPPEELREFLKCWLQACSSLGPVPN